MLAYLNNCSTHLCLGIENSFYYLLLKIQKESDQGAATKIKSYVAKKQRRIYLSILNSRSSRSSTLGTTDLKILAYTSLQKLTIPGSKLDKIYEL